MTKDEVNKLIAGLEQNVTVNGGNDYNITINSTESKNLLAASKALLSAVSITCTFKVTVSTIFGTTGVQEKQTAGAGVIYRLDKENGDAYIITNYHVVYLNGANTEDSISDDIKVYLYGQEYEQYAIYADYIGGSKNYDIAVLKVKGSNVLRESNAVAAEFADSNDVCVLDTAIAIGNPAAIGISATVGSINVDSENLTMTGIDGTGRITLRVMRIDTAINGGNSGGGLFNDTGKLIGIVNAKISDSSIDNIGYAIPSNVAKNIADNIIYYDTQNPENDSVYRILIGVTVGIASARTEYDTETGKVHKIEDVRIESVTVGGVSDGKLVAGDIVRSVVIDGVTYEIVRTFNVIDVMLNARTTSSVIFNVERNGEAISVNFDLSGVTPVEY
jgi:serine protease Do